MKRVIKLLISFYLFILSIELIKNASSSLSSHLNIILTSVIQNNPLKAISTGWLTTSIAQSSGVISFISATFAGNNIISIQSALFIIMGAGIGTAITALMISLLSKGKRRDFRHGFEIGFVVVIYNIILTIILFLLEYFFNVFSKLVLFLADSIKTTKSTLPSLNFVELITSPLTNLTEKIPYDLITLILGLIFLYLSLRYVSKSILELFGGEEKTRRFINKYFRNKYEAFAIGVILTAILFSSSITIGIVVSLAVARVINLKKAIPYVIGAKVGTSTDTILASLISGNSLTIAVSLMYLLFGIISSIIFLPITDILFKTCKYCSKRLMKLTRVKALMYFILFLLIPILILLA